MGYNGVSREGYTRGITMNQADVETFLMLVKTRNLTKTAQNLFLSQPTVSHRLKLLEEELGVQLLIRKKGYKRIELTSKGEEFVPLAERWLSLMHETMILRNENDQIHLNVGCTDTLNSTIFPELYRRIMRDESLHLHLNITTHYSYELYENLENYTVDVGFVYHHLHFKTIESEPILHEKMFIVQESTGAVRKEKLFLKDLDPANEIYFIWEANYQIWHDQVLAKAGVKPVTVDVFSLLAEFLKEPGKWTIAPLSVVRALEERQDVCVSEIGDRRQPPERVTYMITHKDMTESRAKAVAIFREQMMVYFKEAGIRTEP